MSIQQSIFQNLIFNEEYFRQAHPHLKAEYFSSGADRIAFELIAKYYDKYEKTPTKNALLIDLGNRSTISPFDLEATTELVNSLVNAPEDLQWLVDNTEKFCQDRALYNAMSRSIEIQSNAELPREEQNNKIPDVGAIPDLLRDALSICFDTSVGHDYFEDYETRWDNYNQKSAKIPFGINILNRITQGGVERKTLNLIMAGVNVGKSLTLCALAADYLSMGQNVLYISMEMSEEAVSKRIDANLMNLSMDDFETLTGGSYKKRIKAISERNKIGKLIIKQFPTGGASVSHFSALMEELKTKKGWKPDVVIIDYLGICASSRLKVFSENSYALVKAIAEELRGFAIRYNVAVWSGAQTNRNGWNSSDIEMGDIAESAGLAATADFILALMENDELAQMGKYIAKQIKSRYGNKAINGKFELGVDKGKQKLYELDTAEEAQLTVPEAHRNMQQHANANATQRAVASAEFSAEEKSKKAAMDEFAATIKF